MPGDFDGDGNLACSDIDLLNTAAVSGSNSLLFDVTGDGLVNLADVHFWITDLKGTLLGDANLDFVVDASDFNIWNSSNFTQNSNWCSGDFNVDGFVDASDFNIWNSNSFQSALLVAPDSGNQERPLDEIATALSIEDPGDVETNPPFAAPVAHQVVRSVDEYFASRRDADDEREVPSLDFIGPLQFWS